MAHECTLCGQIAGDPRRNDLAALVEAPWAGRPVLAEAGAAVVMPSIGALVPGHVLVCPATHHRSLVAAPRDVAHDVRNLVATTRSRIEALTGLPSHVFEHGSSRDGPRVACSVEHAHVHIVPTDVDVRSAIGDVAQWRPVRSQTDGLDNAAGVSEYLFYEAPTGQCLVATSVDGFPSQLLRRVFAGAIGVDGWNWRTDPAVDRVEATAELLLEAVA